MQKDTGSQDPAGVHDVVLDAHVVASLQVAGGWIGFCRGGGGRGGEDSEAPGRSHMT